MQKALIIIGLACLAAGLLWPMIARIGLGRLPGDIVIEGERTSFYFPIVTCIVLSILLSVVLWLFNR
jgi:hypothetical protein